MWTPALPVVGARGRQTSTGSVRSHQGGVRKGLRRFVVTGEYNSLRRSKRWRAWAGHNSERSVCFLSESCCTCSSPSPGQGRFTSGSSPRSRFNPGAVLLSKRCVISNSGHASKAPRQPLSCIGIRICILYCIAVGLSIVCHPASHSLLLC